MKFHFLCAVVVMLGFAATSGRADPPTDKSIFQNTPVVELPMMEVIVPEPPTVLHAGGRSILCYEVFVTNMFRKPFALDSVRVVTGDGTPLLESSGKALKASLVQAGKAPSADAAVPLLKNGERLIFYAWIDLPAGVALPGTIQHELRFLPEKGESLTIHAAEAPVKDVVRTIEPPLRGDDWAAVNGPSNVSVHRRALITVDGRAQIAQRYAIDWLQLDKDGKSFDGDPHVNAHFHLCDRNSPLAAQGIPYVFQQFAVTAHISASESSLAEIHRLSAPEARRNEMPLENEIVSFSASVR